MNKTNKALEERLEPPKINIIKLNDLQTSIGTHKRTDFTVFILHVYGSLWR